jgi:hypothetical protein
VAAAAAVPPATLAGGKVLNPKQRFPKLYHGILRLVNTLQVQSTLLRNKSFAAYRVWFGLIHYPDLSLMSRSSELRVQV